MLRRFEQVRRAQTDFQPMRALASRFETEEDWAERVVHLTAESRYKEVEQIAEQLFRHSKEPHAFVCMVSAACKMTLANRCEELPPTHPPRPASSSLGSLHRTTRSRFAVISELIQSPRLSTTLRSRKNDWVELT